MERVGSTQNGWELFPHDADIGVRGYGASPQEAFANAARAMTSAISPLEKIDPRVAVEVSCEASDLDVLFADWLNAVIYEMATRGMLFRDFDVGLEGPHFRATLRGEPVDVARHDPSVEPKGATFTGLAVSQRADGVWIAECIVDV